MSSVLLSFVLMFSVSAEVETKETCTRKNFAIRGRLGTQRDQGDTNWCYAHALADLVTWNVGKSISAADIAVTHNLNRGKHMFAGYGSSNRAFTAVNEKGFCLDSKFKVDESGNRSLVRRHYSIGPAQDGVARPHVGSPEFVKDLFIKSRPIVPSMDFETFKRIYHSSDTNNFYLNLREAACEPRLKIDKEAYGSEPSSVDEWRQVLNQGLNEGQPLAYVGNVKCMGIGDPNAEGNHIMSIVGRMWKEGSCKYVVRNSWGQNDATMLWDAERLAKCGTYISYLRNPSSAPSSSDGVRVNR